MIMNPSMPTIPIVRCPVCGHADWDNGKRYCRHFLGWTDDGKSITDPVQGRMALVTPEPVRPLDLIVKTGAAFRVYRNE